MRTLSRFPRLLILLAFVCFFATTTIADHDEFTQESHWFGDLYGSTQLWGLSYSYPWAESMHQIVVCNEGNQTAQYLYECKISVLQDNVESKHPFTETTYDIDPGVTLRIPNPMDLDLRRATKIGRGQRYTLSCYTRIKLTNSKRKTKGWRVESQHDYTK